MNRIEELFKRYRKPIRAGVFFLQILSIVIILFIVLELVSTGIVFIYRNFSSDSRLELETYSFEPWAEDYWKEYSNSNRFVYSPYEGFKRFPGFDGKYVTIDERSIRRTVNPCDSGDANTIDIYVLGGSTVWGVGVRDEETIPSLLSKNLCAQNFDVRVKNLGENAYTSTQEIIRLMNEIRVSEHKPEIVIFYDGVNDVFSSYQHNEAGKPHNTADREYEFNLRKRSVLTRALLDSNLKRILDRILPPSQRESHVNSELAKETVNVYQHNTRIAESLESEFEFSAFYYWQPAIFTKSLLSEEELEKINIDNEFGELYQQSTQLVRIFSISEDLSDIFDGNKDTIFIDQLHVSGAGNQIIAERIAIDIVEHLNEENL